MKLFLSSTIITKQTISHFVDLVGKPVEDISFCLIENAVDLLSDEQKEFMYKTRENLKMLGIVFVTFDLRKYIEKKEDLEKDLTDFDVIWCGGGDTFYLRSLIEKTDFKQVVKNLLENGKVYGGGSAGAIIAGPTLKYFDLVDDSYSKEEKIYDGLGLTNEVVIPHWGVPEFQEELERIKKHYESEPYHLNLLSDEQTLLINKDKAVVIP